jgi:carbon monoxide dehydrogenase subunit G
MLLAATEYVRPDSLEDALAALGETRLAMDFEIVEQRPSEYVRISGLGSPGENQLLSIELDLASDGEQTVASWSADVQLRGVLRSLLQRGPGSLFTEQVEAVLAAGALLSEASSER